MKTSDIKMKSKILGQIKTRICNRLNGCARKWLMKKVKLTLIVFIIISSGISLFVASKAIFGKPDLVLFKRSQNQVPVLPRSYPDYHVERTILLHKKIEHMKGYLDSLSLRDTSRYQAILKANPNLLKDIQSIELLFHQLNQK